MGPLHCGTKHEDSSESHRSKVSRGPRLWVSVHGLDLLRIHIRDMEKLQADTILTEVGERIRTQEVAMRKNDMHSPPHPCTVRPHERVYYCSKNEETEAEDDSRHEHWEKEAPEATGAPGHIKRNTVSKSKEVRTQSSLSCSSSLGIPFRACLLT